MNDEQSAAASDASGREARLAPDAPFSRASGPGLRLVRRRARWSTAKRRVLAIGLSAFALPAAFPPIQDLSKWWIFVPALFVWLLPIGRLFIPFERITGMWPVRREVWLRPASESSGGWIAVIDGRETRSRSAQVFCRKSVISFEGGRADIRGIPVWTVALRLDNDLYEIERTSAATSAETLARVLAQQIHGDPSKVAKPHAGPDAWRPEYLSALDADFVPILMKAIGLLLMSLGTNDLRFALVGAFAVAVRVALVIQRLANATAVQVDQKTFAKEFGGALPARPMQRLKPKPASRVLFWSRALMYSAAGSVLLQFLISGARR